MSDIVQVIKNGKRAISNGKVLTLDRDTQTTDDCICCEVPPCNTGCPDCADTIFATVTGVTGFCAADVNKTWELAHIGDRCNYLDVAPNPETGQNSVIDCLEGGIQSVRFRIRQPLGPADLRMDFVPIQCLDGLTFPLFNVEDGDCGPDDVENGEVTFSS